MLALHALEGDYLRDQTYAYMADLALAYTKPISTGDWSSLIGIVTAIVGNVLISFALNLQRYAHVRLQREARGQSLDLSRRKARNGQNGDDAQLKKQSKIAEGLARKNAASSPERTENGRIVEHDDEQDEAHETDALLPKSRGSDSDDSSSISSPPRSEDEKDGEGKRKNYLKSPFWWLGISLMVVGEAGNFLAYGFAPASIVSPLGVVALISNCLIAPIMLKEPFRKKDVLGVIIAVGGAVTVVLSAKGSNPKLGPHQIWLLISQWEFLTYFGVTVVAITALMFASNKYGDKSVMIDIGLVGLFGGYTALATKGVASLLSYRLLRVFTFPISYLLVAVLIGTAVMQIKYVNRALQRFNSTQVIPTQFVFFTIFVVVGSALLYRDFEETTAAKVAQFVGGVMLTFLGVWCITSGRDMDSSDDDDTIDEEHGIDMVDDEEGSSDDEGNGTFRRPGADKPTIIRPSTPSPPSTPKTQNKPATPYLDTPASFATASSRLGPSPSPSKPPILTSSSSPLLPSQQARPPKTGTTPSQSQITANLQFTQHSSSTLHPARPITPANRSQSAFHTSSDHQTPIFVATASSSSPIPRQLLSRHSIAAGMLPGPYTSPLSGGLSVLVADSRRRDEKEEKGTARRRSTRQSRSQSQSQAAAALVRDGALLSGSAVVDGESSRKGPEIGRVEISQGIEVSGRPRVGSRSNSVEVATDDVGKESGR